MHGRAATSSTCRINAACCTAVLLLTTICQWASAFPTMWAGKHLATKGVMSPQECRALPDQAMKCHKKPVPDLAASITIFPGPGDELKPGSSPIPKPVLKVCPGELYEVEVKFPNKRLAYMTSNSKQATVMYANQFNRKCANSLVFSTATGYQRAQKYRVLVRAPEIQLGYNGVPWTIMVASADNQCSAFKIVTLSVPVSTVCKPYSGPTDETYYALSNSTGNYIAVSQQNGATTGDRQASRNSSSSDRSSSSNSNSSLLSKMRPPF